MAGVRRACFQGVICALFATASASSMEDTLDARFLGASRCRRQRGCASNMEDANRARTRVVSNTLI
ncbi:hypothetical protein PF010_g1077 [Phytophthora fragariae]|uniref:RxLR effector protein n=2 Tax=Phytophthora TaxID=4783 RepID=A0A6G0M136_9STRA|nr:hypothetical protein PR001_g25180 [Phytophthora rubi]KAE9138111.1 hypothetical protein PF010_g1077 [Phytophthora fragariae]KAE9021970.1 hypothetical protein PR002_g12105 [Phytophthora rubi]KAE9254530.1 hypothetical protein PF004_g998 [Phytophthora fragariae]KAE9284709.1 hypothetical protein PR003_g26786 [Phytophthora rubi]